MIDEEVFNIIDNEFNRQSEGIELIASENYVSDDVLKAMGSILTNKYAEGYPGHRYYGGCEFVDEIETLAKERLKKLYNSEYVNVQPHSGSQANMAVLMSCLKEGDTLLGLDLSHGGHLTHGSPVSFSGKLYNVVSYITDKETGLINYDDLEIKANIHKPKVIIGGASAYSREWDYARIREIADKIGAIFIYDMAHTAGLIAAGLLENPLKYAHIVTSTTHKTLRGPRGGIILIGTDFLNPNGIVDNKGNIKMMSQVIDSTVFPGIQGGPLEHIIAAKAVAFGEALKPEFIKYQEQVIKNAKVMATTLMNYGYKVLTDGTDNHCVLIDLRYKFPEMTGKLAEQTLLKVGITTNKNMVPYDTRSPFHTSGLRLGTPAITTRGLKEEDIVWVVDQINIALTNYDNEEILRNLKEKIKNKMSKYPLFK